ncbi:MAG: hypothetical protein WCA76_08260 [Candidatus Sulfotelmatobacter sp.]|jgi:hypothetical protein
METQEGKEKTRQGSGEIDFDWMEARAQCSLSVIFEQLKGDVRNDVEKAQATRKTYGEGLPAHYGFRLVFTDNGRAIKVLVNGQTASGTIHDSVSFHLTEKAIEVRDVSEAVKFEATLTLNGKGECRLRINDEEQELWYLRKLALEDLFFRKY